MRTSRPLQLAPVRDRLRPNPVFGYVRKSKEEDSKQVMSLIRQREAIEQFVAARGWGSVDRWYEDAQSGKDFVRPGYEAMLRDVAANPNVGGRVVVLDYDRFARPVDKQLRVKTLEFQRQLITLDDAGWSLDYVLTPRTGNAVQDDLMGAMKSAMAAEYIEKLSRSSRSGKRKVGVAGYWNGGPPPFPAERYDSRTGRRLGRGERASNASSVLGPPSDPMLVQHWLDGAQMILAGAALDAVAQEFAKRGVPTYYGGLWRHAHIEKVYTNPALIGRVEYTFTSDDGVSESVEGQAQWGPIVPEDVYRAVNDELRRRRGGPRARPNREYVLDLVCQHCGVRYVAATTIVRSGPRKGETKRFYTHPVPSSRMNDVQAARTSKAGCKHWYIDADEAEHVVRDTIVAHRGNRDFLENLAARVNQQGEIEREAEVRERTAEDRVKELQRKRANVIATSELADDDETRAFFVQRVAELSREIGEAKTAWMQERQRREDVSGRGEEILRLAEEAQNVAETWDASVENRRVIVETWIDRVEVAVEREEGRQRRNVRHLYVFLRTAPQMPVTRLLGDDHAEGNISSAWLRSVCSVLSTSEVVIAPLSCAHGA